MKNNTVRAHRNGGTSRPSAPVKTPAVQSRFGPQFDIQAEEKNINCLCIFNLEDGQPVSRVPLRDEEMTALFEAQFKGGPIAIKGGPEATAMTLIVAEAVRAWLAKPESDQLGFNALDDLQEAIQQSQALFTLLNKTMNGHSTDTYNDDIQCGLLHLIYLTVKHLKSSHQTLQSIFRPSAPAPVKGVAS